MKTYYIEYKKHTDSKWATYTTTAASNTEAYNNIYRDLGNVYAVRLKDVIDQDDIEAKSQYDPIPPLIFIILFVIVMHLIFR
jgi:hypothetical protein